MTARSVFIRLSFHRMDFRVGQEHTRVFFSPFFDFEWDKPFALLFSFSSLMHGEYLGGVCGFGV